MPACSAVQACHVAEREGGVEVRTAHGAHEKGVGRADVGSEHLGPVDLWPSVQAADRRADGLASRRHRLGRARARCAQNGGDDAGISRAATEDTGQSGADLVLGRIGRAREKFGGSHHHAGGADTALGRALGEECVPQTVRRAATPGLERLDAGAVDLAGRNEAGAGLPPVDQHGAGTAVARVAADLHAFQAEVIAQHLGQASGRVGFDLLTFASDVEGQRHAGTCAKARRTSSAAAWAR